MSTFSHKKNPNKMQMKEEKILTIQRKIIPKSGNFHKTCIFQDYFVYSYIYISILSSNCTQMQMANLFTLGPNISQIREVCDTHDTTSLTSLVDNQWSTAGLRVHSSFLKAGIRCNPLFLLKGITILPSTPYAGYVVT